MDELRSRGFVVLRGLVDAERVARANAAIDADLAAHFDPARQGEYDAISACPDLRESPVIADLLATPALQRTLDTLLPMDRMRWGSGQIAVRWAHPGGEPGSAEPHIDGISTGDNGVIGPLLHTFTALVGVFLTPSHGPSSGNFSVWPGSTALLRDWFASRGRRALLEGMPPVPLGEPLALEVEPGDVVIASYLLAHGCAPNTSAHQRRAVFYRGHVRGLALHRYRSLVDPWRDWRR